MSDQEPFVCRLPGELVSKAEMRRLAYQSPNALLAHLAWVEKHQRYYKYVAETYEQALREIESWCLNAQSKTGLTPYGLGVARNALRVASMAEARETLDALAQERIEQDIIEKARNV